MGQHVLRIGAFVLLGTTALAPLTASAAQEMPGLTERLIEVDGRQVQVWVGGPENPSLPLVVFENGWNGTAGSWARVAPEVARFARVLLYNRAGHGRSEGDGQLPTPEHVARRFRALMAAQDLDVPLVLVGHSWGGPLIRAHAALFPEMVSGLVYVDPGLPCVLEAGFESAGHGALAAEFIDRFQAPDPVGVRIRDVQTPTEESGAAPPDVPAVLLIGLKLDMHPVGRQWLGDRGADADTIIARTREHKVSCLSPFATELPRGLFVVTPGSGHVIQQDEPELVVWAIQRVLSQLADAADPVVSSPVQPETLYALTNVTLIDGTGGPPRPSMTVLIEHGRIRDIFGSTEHSVPDTIHTVDLAGRYLIPGLINTHLHLASLRPSTREGAVEALERMFYAGVTTVREMVGDTRVSGELARAALVGERPIPRIHYAALVAGSTFFDDPRVPATSVGYGAGLAPWAQAITAETDIPQAIARAQGTGAAGIKIYADLDAELVRSIVSEAHRQGLHVWAHGTVFPTGPLESVRAGIDGLSHTCYMFWGLQPNVAERRASRAPFDAEAVDPTGPMWEELFSEMSARGVVLDATASNAALRNPGARAMGCSAELLSATLKAAHGAGVPISTGTDYWIPEGEPDPTLLTEIEYLVDAGVLSPLEVLTAATLNGARAIGIHDSLGSIEVGKVADMVVLGRDPVQDIAALRDVTVVIKEGIIYRRRDYRP